MLKKILSLVVFSFFTLFGVSSHLNESPTLYNFLNDIKNYKCVNMKHPGDLFQHSMWVHFAAIELVEQNSVYSKDLNFSEREKDLFYLAALLHDIGKAGRKELFEKTHPSLAYQITQNPQNNEISIGFMFDRQEHCKVGFEYIAAPYLDQENGLYKPQKYLLSDGKTNLDLELLFEELGVTSLERKEIAILVGIHYSFGDIGQGKMTQEEFIKKIQKLASACNYTPGVTERLLRLSILIQVSDVKGIDQILPQKCVFLKKEYSAAELAPVRPVFDPSAFKLFGYSELYDPAPRRQATLIMNELLAYFKEYQTQDTISQIQEFALI